MYSKTWGFITVRPCEIRINYFPNRPVAGHLVPDVVDLGVDDEVLFAEETGDASDEVVTSSEQASHLQS